jgi:deoxycytidine triphosphate deaminase
VVGAGVVAVGEELVGLGTGVTGVSVAGLSSRKTVKGKNRGVVSAGWKGKSALNTVVATRTTKVSRKIIVLAIFFLNFINFLHQQ